MSRKSSLPAVDPDIRPGEQWVILSRKTVKDPWQVRRHHVSGRVYRYDTLERAIRASGTSEFAQTKKRDGLLKLERADRVDPKLLEESRYAG